MLTPVIGQGWLKAKGSWGWGLSVWGGDWVLGSEGCDGISGRWLSKRGHPLISLQTALWPHIDPHLNLERVSDLLLSGCGWLPYERHSCMSDAWAEPFYFWTCGWNRVYCYYHCQSFNSLMVAYWISARAVAPVSPALTVIRVLQLNRQRLAPTFPPSTLLYPSQLNRTAVKYDSRCLPYSPILCNWFLFTPSCTVIQDHNNYHWYPSNSGCQ